MVDDPNLHREKKGGKRGELDIRVNTKRGEIIDVEMEATPSDTIRERIAKNNKAMKEVVVTLREMSADEAERRLAEAREKDIRDRLATEQYFKRIAKQESEEEVKKAREEI